MQHTRLFLRALIAFLALPGVIAFGIPLLLLRPRGDNGGFRTMAFAPLFVGVATLLWCVGEFSVRGRGTLAPWDPPQALVRTGLYRFSRNPMYVGVLLILASWAVGWRSSLLGWYALGVAVAFHLRVIVGEEPWLARTYGAVWAEYRARVPRWLI